MRNLYSMTHTPRNAFAATVLPWPFLFFYIFHTFLAKVILNLTALGHIKWLNEAFIKDGYEISTFVSFYFEYCVLYFFSCIPFLNNAAPINPFTSFMCQFTQKDPIRMDFFFLKQKTLLLDILPKIWNAAIMKMISNRKMAAFAPSSQVEQRWCIGRSLRGTLIPSRLLAAEPAACSATNQIKMIQLTKHKWSAIKLAHLGHTNDTLNYKKVWQCRSISVSGYYIYITGMSHSITNSLNVLDTQIGEGQYETNLMFLWKPSKIVIYLVSKNLIMSFLP